MALFGFPDRKLTGAFDAGPLAGAEDLMHAGARLAAVVGPFVSDQG